MENRLCPAVAVCVAVMMTASACGGNGSGSNSTPTSPTPSGSATFTITSSGVSPRTVTVPAGSRVTFVNNDSRPHDMASNPHPEHSDCPPINDVGFLQPGQTRTTGNLNTPRTCGFHDHGNPLTTSLQGTIVIQ